VGKTIKKNVEDHLNQELSGIEAIRWAMIENHTTKPKKDNIPGGLGLKIIKEFVKLNKGKVQIVSSDGYYEFKKGREKYETLVNAFPGTLVNLEFNLDDQSFYYLEEEEIEDIIF
jgi:hypothetical protein